jgi:Holliday junction resolvasome RuvABC endonuclease subunit
MRALGLDPSLRAYGWCIFDSEASSKRKRRVISGHEKTLPTTVLEVRFVHFRSLVTDLLRRFSVDVVGLESPAYGGGHFSENHFGLMMYSREAVFEARKDLVLFDPTTLKYLTGRGSQASKQDMQRFVQLETMNPNPIQNDEADAFCAARFATRFMQVREGLLDPDDLSKFEKRVFLQRTRKVKRVLGGSVTKRTAHVFRENSRFFAYSKVPQGDVDLPDKDAINPDLLKWLESDG